MSASADSALLLVTLAVAAVLGVLHLVFGRPVKGAWGRGVVAALAVYVAVPTTNLDPDDPLRLVVPLAAAGVLALSWVRRPARPHGAGFGLLLALVLLTGWRSSEALNAGATSAFLSALVTAIPLAWLGSGLLASERRMVARGVAALALAQVAVAVLEVTVLGEPLWGAPISPLTDLPTQPPNELLGGDAFRAQGSMGHPLPMGILLIIGLVLVGRNAVEWGRRPVGLALAALAVGILLNGSRSVVLLALVLGFLVVGGRAITARSTVGAILAGVAGAFALSTDYVQEQLGTLTRSGSYTHRLDAFASVDRLMSRPRIGDVWLGNGYGSTERLFRTGYLQVDGFFAVDNQYVLTIAEAGLLGLLLLIALYAGAALRSGPDWLRLMAGSIIAMSFIFDVLAWASSLAVLAVFLPMAWSIGAQPNKGAGSEIGHGTGVSQRSEALAGLKVGSRSATRSAG